MRVSLFFLALLLLGHLLQAQEAHDLGECIDSAFCNPTINGLPRSKGVVFTYERLVKFDINSVPTDEAAQAGYSEVNSNRRISFKFKVPLIHRPGFKLLGGFTYKHEQFRFDEMTQIDYPLYQNLEDKSLKTIGGSLYMIKPFRGKRFFVTKLGANLNGDYFIGDLGKQKYLKANVASIVGWKPNDWTTYGFGLALGYSFGRPSIYPLLGWSKTFDPHWGIELLLPVEAKLRYNVSPHTILYFKSEIYGSSYNVYLNDPVLTTPFNPYYLQQSELRNQFVLEQEIYDFLWFGVNAGMRNNLEFTLSSANSFQPDVLVRSHLGKAFFFNTSLFMVVPRKFIQ